LNILKVTNPNQRSDKTQIRQRFAVISLRQFWFTKLFSFLELPDCSPQQSSSVAAAVVLFL